MAITKLYSHGRTAKTKQAALRHDVLPDRLRTQILTVLNRIIGRDTMLEITAAYVAWNKVNEILCHEYAVPSLLEPEELAKLPIAYGNGHVVCAYFKDAQVAMCLDIIQLSLAMFAEALAQNYPTKDSKMSLEEGIAEINERFKQNGIGYQIVDGQILRLDSGVMYQQATLPAVALLHQPYLAGANQEFMSAQEHFRHSRYKECLNDCLKAFESTMKAICHKRKWAYAPTDTAKTLIKLCEDNGLFPVFMQTHVTALRTILESGVPTARNKTSGHGQGVTPITVSEDFASYVLNLTASNILFFATAEQKKK